MPRKPKDPIPQNLKWEVHRRDGFACHYCGVTEGPLTLDHKVPESEGGPTVADNLVSACPRCNLRKATKSYRGFKDELALEKRDVSLVVRGSKRNGRLGRSMRWRRHWPARLKEVAIANTEEVWWHFLFWYAEHVYLSIETRVVRASEQDDWLSVGGSYAYGLHARWIVRHLRWCDQVGMHSEMAYLLADCVKAACDVFFQNLEKFGSCGGKPPAIFRSLREDRVAHAVRLMNAVNEHTVARNDRGEAVALVN